MHTQSASSFESGQSAPVWVGDPGLPRHLKITGVAPAFGFERCEDTTCVVGLDGTAGSCGRLACPACGCGGTNLTTNALLDRAQTIRVSCSCGYSWVREEQFALAASAVAD